MMMDFDCPLAFYHKKGEYIWTLVEDFCSWGERFCLLELVEFRLYLGASLCMYHFWLLMYYFWAIHVRGRYIVIYVSCFIAH